jgi:hypothetical protein
MISHRTERAIKNAYGAVSCRTTPLLCRTCAMTWDNYGHWQSLKDAIDDL